MNKKEMIDFFDERAKERDKWRRKNRYYYEELEKLLKFIVGEKKSILEIGCGTGETLNNLHPIEGWGIDFSEKMIATAKKKFKHMNFKVADAENYRINKKFDFIILTDTINLFEDVQKVFTHIRKESCKPETRVILTFHNPLWEPVLNLAERLKLKMPNPLQNWLSAEDIKNLLELSDFETIKEGQRILIPRNIPFLSSIFNKYLSQLPILRKLCFFNYIVARPKGLRNKVEKSCSVIIPARNEAGNIERAIEEMPRLCKNMEIIFVEGGSTDNTYQKIKRVAKKYKGKWNIKYMKQDGIGKGNAVRKGFDSAKGDILMILDADLTVPPKDLTKFYNAMKEDKGEFINGTRLVYPMEKEAMRTLNKIGNKIFSIIFTWLLGQRFKDTLCGTKVLYKKDYEELKKNRKYFGEFDPFGDFDLIFGASKMNLKIVEVPIRYRERTYGDTNISRFKHGWLLLKMSLFAMRKIKFF